MIILLDKLEDLIDNAPEIHNRAVLLDSDELLELIEKIRNAVPEEVKRAEIVSTERIALFRKDSSDGTDYCPS